MTTRRKQPYVPSWSAAALVVAALAAGAHLAPSGPGATPAEAALPVGTPTFSAPLTIDNPFFPIQPGAVKVFTGRDGREAVTTVDFHLVETRTFQWNGGPVACRIIRESAFIDGELLETSWNYFAQADDGSVYAFGELNMENLIDGADTDPDDSTGSWVVGAAGPGDPEDIATIPDPTLFMPANPQRGDVWTAKDVPGVDEETLEVQGVDRRLRVPAEKYALPLRVLVRSPLSAGVETKWFVRGVGEAQSRSSGEKSRLLASTLGTR